MDTLILERSCADRALVITGPRQPGLLTPFAQYDLDRVGLSRVAVATYLQPRLLTLMPAFKITDGERIGSSGHAPLTRPG